MIDFNNTEIAFAGKNDKELKRAYFLFKMLSFPLLVKIGKALTLFAFKIRFPIKRLVKRTIFAQFCGGESIEESKNKINVLGKYKIGTILDYSVEGQEDDNTLDKTCEEIIKTAEIANNNLDVPFCVFKVTGVAKFTLLEKISSNLELSSEEKQSYLKVVNRVDSICKKAFESQTPVFIDAEESWIQPAIDGLAESMMAKYNKEKTIVYNTIQIYRHDRLDFLKASFEKAKKGNYKIGIKLVRGAYMEKERIRAKENNYTDPIQKSKEDTDKDYNLAVEFCLQNISIISLCAGTHNEKSVLFTIEVMDRLKIDKSDKRIYFAQLLGMSDHLSYNLAQFGYNVAKYVPYGPVKEVLPYLMRRAEENTSVKGQTGRELSLLMSERNRRKKIKA